METKFYLRDDIKIKGAQSFYQQITKQKQKQKKKKKKKKEIKKKWSGRHVLRNKWVIINWSFIDCS